MKIITSDLAVTMEVIGRNFPESRHRSRRIEKKLIRRFGGVWKHKHTPTAYRHGSTLIVHPALYAELMKETHQ